MSEPPAPSWHRIALMAGAVLCAISFVALAVLILQPWASCPANDDSSAGCPVGPGQALLQAGVGGLLAVGLISMVAGLVGQSRAHPSV